MSHPAIRFQDQIKSVIATFLSDSSTPSSRLSAILAKDWWYTPRYQGGLGLTQIEDSVNALQIHALVRVINSVRKYHHSLPSWMSPVIKVFHQAMTPRGRPLDILYA
ncbi:uncharacterized protein PHALS_03899 [Plasmopara halstedii]|uniref:Uncharacterized protein n=1 Tax=Plasmopara halstedii TaxID=4781 RepID=A0A0P1B068_PLAHL|nr:uncharacterized protein PHALS_03899 [Plasmopara halstedii]CEG47252.1 hypothetical protein PHALS_03899 [Plasmopara halstedii]|eukprot:XP_024583621.1 hypothetical protein PHALS_03899 [Plasmopara halstedii]